jgi:hypothetical protein
VGPRHLSCIRVSFEAGDFYWWERNALKEQGIKNISHIGDCLGTEAVRDFVDQIDTTNQGLHAGIANVLSDEIYNNFAMTCAYLSNFIKVPKPGGAARSIGAAGSSDRKFSAKRGGKSGKKAGNTSSGIDANGFQYAFTADEWNQLSETEKEAVKKRRAAYNEKKKDKKRKLAAAVADSRTKERTVKARTKPGSSSVDEITRSRNRPDCRGRRLPR